MFGRRSPARRPESRHDAFYPQRDPLFRPPALPQDESSFGSTFVADLSSVNLPPVDYETSIIWGCDACGARLNGRPRVHCLQCPDYDVCSECFHFNEVAGRHQLSHMQKTLRPLVYPSPLSPGTSSQRSPNRANPNAAYFCDFCSKDLTFAPRARCVDCKNYDLCLDCNLIGATSMKHRGSHNVNIITSHLEPAPVLMGNDMAPTELLVKLVDALFQFVDERYRPIGTGLVEAAKISAFYATMGVKSSDNIGRLPNEQLSLQYSSMGCEYYLVSDKSQEIESRTRPWSLDNLDTTPRTPALTRHGWIRFFILSTWRNPDLMHYLLSSALSTGAVMHKRKGEPYRLSVPRQSFPAKGTERRSERRREEDRYL